VRALTGVAPWSQKPGHKRTLTTDNGFIDNPGGHVKRLVTLVLVMLGAVAVALVPAGAASAHAGFHVVSISGSMTIKDADWPDGDDYAYPNFSRDLTLSSTVSSASAQFTGCADEVRIVLDVTATHNPSPFGSYDVTISTRTRLYEGSSCSTTDLDASGSRSFVVGGWTTKSDQWVVSSDGNSVSILMSVRNSPA
jgi:hypothetical protein